MPLLTFFDCGDDGDADDEAYSPTSFAVDADGSVVVVDALSCLSDELLMRTAVVMICSNE